MAAESCGAAFERLVTLGKVTSVYGVRGWVKIYSHTEPMDNILSYSPWQIKLEGRWQAVEVEQGKRHGKGLVAKLAGSEDREQARRYCGAEIAVERSRLPGLAPGEFYWHQLEKLNVVTESGEKLGRVDHLIPTGSNDVLVVKGNAESVDRRERLIPYLPEQVVKEINLETGTIRVDWDPEF
ncbi:ribosome maturation factor RimM [Motiliproteus sp. SC1-56]|uniref:ribosome maturation factor RimM n=1 Tax=Motiliproteus sp. SC1-56 TaxID=2799565 RepID=UPI001A8FF0CB|nr:ribosome maturation factor RimM [Motiliproteus sp. SC1-56]